MSYSEKLLDLNIHPLGLIVITRCNFTAKRKYKFIKHRWTQGASQNEIDTVYNMFMGHMNLYTYMYINTQSSNADILLQNVECLDYLVMNPNEIILKF